MLEVTLQHRQGGFALDLDFAAPEGVTALFGRSGAGKTTVVNAVAGLLRPDAGRVVLDGRVLWDARAGIWLSPQARDVGYVFQNARLFPHMNVQRNLDYGRRAKGIARDSALESRVIAMLGIGDLLDRRPAGLSGGERQRVAIGRALLSAPRMLLLDEPLAALDEARKGEILPYLERLRDEAGLPILYVSHSLSEVARLATTVVALHQGRVLRSGPAGQVLADPDTVTATGVREAGALLQARVVAHHDDGLSELEFSGGTLFLPRVSAAPGQSLRVRVQARDVILSRQRPTGLSALNILEARVSAVRSGEGPGAMVQLACGDDHLLARLTQRSTRALEIGEGVKVFAVIKTVSVARDDVGGA